MPPRITLATATGAFGRLFAFWAVCVSPAAAPDPCEPPPALPIAEVRRVVDGDTWLLAEGERVRLVGLDTPELGRDGAPDAPLAEAARAHLQMLVDLAGGRVRLRGDARDHYGRKLAVVYTDRHGDVAAHLIGRGLAFVSPVPLDGLQCHQAAVADARAHDLGVWAGDAQPATAVARTGFAVVRGTSGDWHVRRDDRLLTLENGLVIRVRAVDAHWFEPDGFARYERATLEVRGWVHPWRPGLAVTVQHPAAIEVVGD